MDFCDIKGVDQTSQVKGPELLPVRPCRFSVWEKLSSWPDENKIGLDLG